MLALDPTDDLARPAFKDAASCTAWLGQLQLTNLNLAQAALRRQLDELNRCALKGSDRLQVLEVLRETITLVQTDTGRKLVGKKLPLSDDEFILLLTISSLWQSFLNGYLRCLQGAESGDKTLAGSLALLCQRCMHYSGLQISNFLRAGCEPDAKSWQQFHSLYAHIEAIELHNEKVPDEHDYIGHPISASTLYASTLLMHRARFLGLSRTQWRVVERWLNLWSDALIIAPRCSVSKSDAPPLGVNLASVHGLQSLQHAADKDSMRFIAMVPLSKQIRIKTILLQQGQTPQQASLGSEMSSKDCVTLLNKLHACWCETQADSLAETAREVPLVQVCIGLEKIYSQLAQKPFRPVKDKSTSQQDARRQIETFGRVLDSTGQHALQELGFVPEEWQVDEDSLTTARLLRTMSHGDRLGVNQLVSVFAPNSNQHKLGWVHMVSVARSGYLYMGLNYFSGQPQPISIRGDSGNESVQSGSAAALMLPAFESAKLPASLVLPRDWFHAGRALDLVLANGSKQKVALGFSVDKGGDFERVSFTLLT
jgi:hypothetical protein